MSLAVIVAGCVASASAFHVPLPSARAAIAPTRLVFRMMADAEVDEASTSPGSKSADGAASLEAKMASWEASEDEVRSSTLGGNLPLVGMPGLPGRVTRTDQPDKMDGFDVGMNISGIILFPLAILLCAFPFFMGSIDVSSVGPPPTA